jgi:hypothetical protein
MDIFLLLISLAFDDNFYFSISKIKKINVPAIGEGNTTTLGRIYTDDEFTYTSSATTSLDYNILEQQDVVLNELETIPQALQVTLKSLVEKVRNVVIIPSSLNNPANLNGF